MCKNPQMVASINKPPPINSNILMFFDQDLEDVHSPYDDALIVKVQISNVMVSPVLVDNGSSVNVLFKDAADKIGLLDSINKGKTTLHIVNGPLSSL